MGIIEGLLVEGITLGFNDDVMVGVVEGKGCVYAAFLQTPDFGSEQL